MRIGITVRVGACPDRTDLELFRMASGQALTATQTKKMVLLK